MVKRTYKKRTYKRNSNKHNITKRKLLHKGGDGPIEYTKEDIEKNIKEYITEKTDETDESDPIHYLKKIIPFMDKRRITDDQKIAYLKLLIQKFLENNENIPDNMYKETIYTISDKKDKNFKTEYFILSKELLCYILRTCLYYYSYTYKPKYDAKKDKQKIFLRTLVSDILRFFFTKQKVDFDKYKVDFDKYVFDLKNGKILGVAEVSVDGEIVESDKLDMKTIFEDVKIYKNFITANYTNAKLDHYVNSILYSDSKIFSSAIINGMSSPINDLTYYNFAYIVGAKFKYKNNLIYDVAAEDKPNIINFDYFKKIKNTYSDEYDDYIQKITGNTRSNKNELSSGTDWLKMALPGDTRARMSNK